MTIYCLRNRLTDEEAGREEEGGCEGASRRNDDGCGAFVVGPPDWLRRLGGGAEGGRVVATGGEKSRVESHGG